MFRGMYISTTGMINSQHRMDTISNNLANTNTNGYKKDGVLSESFPEQLLRRINDNSTSTIKPFQGVELTQNGEEYLLETKGAYFAIDTPAGTGYDDKFKFRVTEDGYLKTYYQDHDRNIKSDGENYLLGKNGRIRITGNNIEIDGQGNVFSGGNLIDAIVTKPHMNVIGTLGNGIRTDRVFINFTQGDIRQTSNPLDMALNGDGFFKVQTENGTRYTRDGSFKIDREGFLTTSEGHRVLGNNGAINIGNGEVNTDQFGNISLNGAFVSRLDIVNIDNKEFLRKEGDNLYRIEENQEAQESAFTGEVLSGYLEGSNVETVKEMVEMISTMRGYESNQKVVKSYDEILQKAVNDIARI
ncbi:flagellar hook-basal body protein [Senegalia massiliensis]|uniref:flagellar hook-basal body protein n=1 Tax=Senegalia massiliensis TaxID=1720316 RepID=UPI0010312C66|nr:flagellar hook-basal body protein [Senegalia massiliensis]